MISMKISRWELLTHLFGCICMIKNCLRVSLVGLKSPTVVIWWVVVEVGKVE